MLRNPFKSSGKSVCFCTYQIEQNQTEYTNTFGEHLKNSIYFRIALKVLKIKIETSKDCDTIFETICPSQISYCNLVP